MQFSDLRVKVRAIILGIAAFVSLFIFLRIITDILKAPDTNFFVSLINSISNVLISPFAGSVASQATGLFSVINPNALVALLVYILGAIVISEVITAFLYDNTEDIIQNLADGIFKVVEFLIFLRIVFEFFAISTSLFAPAFINAIYSLTAWTQGIFPQVPIGDGALDLSALFVLAVIVVVDILFERFLNSIFRRVETIRKNIKVRTEIKKEATKAKLKEKEESKKPPVQQNITINIPVPPQPQVVVNPTPVKNVVMPVPAEPKKS